MLCSYLSIGSTGSEKPERCQLGGDASVQLSAGSRSVPQNYGGRRSVFPLAAIGRACFGSSAGVWMGVFRAYFDASGSPDPEISILTVAGYISTEEKWTEFEREWQAILESEGVRCFHMADFAHSINEFDGWKHDEPRRISFLQRLASAIGKHTEQDFSMSLYLDDYRIVDRIYKLSELTRPYPLAAFFVISEAWKWMQATHRGDPVVFILEKGDTHQDQLIPSLKTWGMDLPVDPVLTKKVWRDENGVDHYCLPLQASDFLAYEQAKTLTDFINKNRRTVRESLFALGMATQTIGKKYKCLGFPFFKSVCDGLGIEKR
jgi:hypothetical protein